MPTEYSLVFPDGRKEVIGVSNLSTIVEASLAVSRNTSRKDSGFFANGLANAIGSATNMHADRNDMNDAYELGDRIGAQLRLQRGESPKNLPNLIKREIP